jgi:hypothetical protein
MHSEKKAIGGESVNWRREPTGGARFRWSEIGGKGEKDLW